MSENNLGTLNVQQVPLNKINPAAYNPRTITEEEFTGLKTSLEKYGQRENLIVNSGTGKAGKLTLVSGHQRFQAMKALGWSEAHCDVIDVDEHTEKKLNVLMNSQAIAGKFDELKLAELLEELKLDEDYTGLRLNTLEPLDLSGVDFDKSDYSSGEDYQNNSIKQLILAYGINEFTDVIDNTDKLIEAGYGGNPSEIYARAVQELLTKEPVENANPDPA